ncbi:DUF2062 domain-containing protein [Moraxella sp. Tifton1]|uniref:DUF2062 domain-containing protein n=1 Tax=Moraxella oculi TaxID=2940516 RepID=UPI0020139B65|nr:DUF2062 domain-containing protein [Moraxella sp. Tifton1]MCL1623606.1 DUF2062 domain-containing protein [Moraxella sp. Tifton1]
MLKQKLKNWLPTPEKLHQSRVMKWFAPFVTDPRLWHMHRDSLTRAVYVGVLCAFFPLPGQMPLAVIGALLLRANIPMAIALTWITNPLTTIPVFWLAYCVGAVLIGEPMIGIRTIGAILTEFTLWISGHGNNPFGHHLFSIKAFIIGLIVCGVITSVALGLIFRLVFEYHIISNWKKRPGYNANTPRFRTQKGHTKRQKSHKDKHDEDFSI